LNKQRVIGVSILLGLAPLFAGCSSKRLPIQGTVTLAKGEKFNGSITFLPARGGKGAAATVKLTEGCYKFDRSNGPSAGRKTVIVRRIVPRRAARESFAENAIPNGKSEWIRTADVTADGDGVYDFDLDD
jgi:hypothetical protein